MNKGCLVLSRRLHESVCIGDDVIITVVGINRNQVKLAISAPRETSVDRSEIRERKLAGDWTEAKPERVV